MKLLMELIQVNESKNEKEWMNLLEDLGNLKKLGVGNMINAFKQTYHGDKKSTRTSEQGPKFSYYSRIGKDSEIKVGTTEIKNWPSFRRETADATAGISVKLNGTPVAVIVTDEGSAFSSKNAVYGVAWDLSKVKLDDAEKTSILSTLISYAHSGGWQDDFVKTGKFKSQGQIVKFERMYRSEKIEALVKSGTTDKKVPVKDYETWYDAMKDGGASIDRSSTVIKASIDGKPAGEWDKSSQTGFFVQYKDIVSNIEKVYNNAKNVQGIAQTTENIKNFITALIQVGKVTVDLILIDSTRIQKRNDRRSNPPTKIVMSDDDIYQAKRDLTTRLAIYKASKLETVEDAGAFLKKVFEGKAKKINFAGCTYTAVPSSQYMTVDNKHSRGVYNSTMSDLIAGKPIKMKFDADRGKGEYNSLELTVKLKNGVLVPISAEFFDANEKKQKTVKLD